MKLHQLSLFVENRPGQLRIPCEALANAGINIVTASLADTQQFGILRLIVRDWEKAKTVLEVADCIVNVTEVVAVEVRDEPGGMAEILAAMEKAEVNIEYMYAFTTHRRNKAVLVFRFDDADQAITQLQKAGINPVSRVELFENID
jgi:hypothetical protein